MSELWERWRIALLPLGIALGLIVAIVAFTAGGPKDAPRSSTGVAAASSPPLVPPPPPPHPIAAPTPPPIAPAPPPAVTATVAAAPIGEVAPAAIQAPTFTTGAPHVPTKAELSSKRADLQKAVDAEEADVKRLTDEATDLEKQPGRTSAAKRRRMEADKLRKDLAEGRNAIADLDKQIDRAPN